MWREKEAYERGEKEQDGGERARSMSKKGHREEKGNDEEQPFRKEEKGVLWWRA